MLFNQKEKLKLPSWFKQPIPDAQSMKAMRSLLETTGLKTVCQSAHCPNSGQCWSKGIATFMILGDICTRGCRFCAVTSGKPKAIDITEPETVAQAVKKLNLNYVVITSVTRDDLPDQGVGQFVKTVEAIRRISPYTKVELLIPDFSNSVELLDEIIKVKPTVIGHNIEMVQRVFEDYRTQANYQRSLEVLQNLSERSEGILIKSGLMVGIGETDEEVVDLLKDLKQVGCEIVTIGQYLSPTTSERHVAVQRFVTPEQFKEYEQIGLGLGFRYIFSGPLVRSSFMAEEGYQASLLNH